MQTHNLILTFNVLLFLPLQTFQVKGDGEIYINITSIIIHPNYNNNSKDNDFALLKLSTPLSISSTVKIACLSIGINVKKPFFLIADASTSLLFATG